MRLTGLLDLLRDSAAYREMLTGLQNGKSSNTALNVIRAARPFALAALAHDWDGPVIYITARVRRAYNVSEQLPVWMGGDMRIHRFAEPSPMFYERAPWDKAVIRNRIGTLAALMPPEENQYTAKTAGFNPMQRAEAALSGHMLRPTENGSEDNVSQPIVVTSARAIMQRTLPVNQFRKGSMVLEVGQRHAINDLIRQWVKAGYEPASMVAEPGTFSHRGGILDIYPAAFYQPVRIDFFDDEIDSMRLFDSSSQRSTGQVKRASITPAREALPEHTPPLAAHLAEWFKTRPHPEDEMTVGLSDADALETGAVFPYIEHYLPYLYPNPVSLLDYAPNNALIVVEDADGLRDTIADITETAAKNREEKLAENLINPDHPAPYFDWETLQGTLQGRTTLYLGSGATVGTQEGAQERVQSLAPLRDADSGKELFTPGGRFGGQLRPLLTHLRGLRDRGDRIVVVTQQTARLADLWYEQDSAGFIPTMGEIAEATEPRSLVLVNGMLQEGWTLRVGDVETHLFTDAEIFGWSRPEPRRRRARRAARLPEAGYADWKAGDYVVHVDYGVGQFTGMQRRTVEGNDREYLQVDYSGTDKLFVPIHQADRLTRYVGTDDKPPALNTLGKQIAWTRVRRKAKKAAEEEARELLALYATRANALGHAFGVDTGWQHELEASFPYIETDDQLQALREVKADMEKVAPMDRLICGDVGYGKTEVALRAAFKAVMDGKQVAVLVPTTVLAQQHYETFNQRLAPFPIKVELMSRFRTKGQLSRMSPKLASGEVDIVIGTHRLLSKDVTFKELGLLIIDEEQRFGVKHKEHFKQLRAQVDVLTMTATPIPRTLHMGLVGVRDISMIQTPPEERLPIVTQVGTFDERLVRQAVLRELERGGQVFFVHNRVQTIETARQRLERIVPEARTVVAHGQMSPRYLEKVMAEFGRAEHDVLVSTSIIENGIDMPTVNTLIVDRSEWFGMAQLYQLRGRVGRGAQQAYAYFFHLGGRKLTEDAHLRLDTLAEHTTLGAGFQIAMRDLELRGAGDILSTRQTGHVAAIGLHLYTQLLTQAVQTYKGREADEPLPAAATERVVIDLPVPAYLPDNWIPELSQRLQIYRRIAGLHNSDDVEMMREELRDRFGKLPAAVDGLLYQMDVKLLAQAAGATAVSWPDERILIKLPYLPNVDREQLEAELGEGVRVTRTAVELEHEEWQLRLLDVLKQLAQVKD